MSGVKRRRICVFTGTRAEYGILRPLLKALADQPSFELQVLVSGAHLDPRFGETWRAIAADGYDISAKVDMQLTGDSPVAIGRSMGLGTIGFADALGRLAPDLAVVVGDRYEVLAFVQAALVARVPVAHIHGGEVTEGAIDESIRHAVTKLSHLHFAAAADYRRRIIQLGEAPERVFAVGALGLDALGRERLLEPAELEAELGLALSPGLLLVTYHPATLGVLAPGAAAVALFAALDRFPELTVLVTGTNADTHGSEVVAATTAFLARNPARARGIASLGSLRYLSAMRHCLAVVGNSSSGIIEAPALGRPTVNVGTRQRGRLRAPSVIDCAEDEAAIVGAIRVAASPGAQRQAAEKISPYGHGGVAEKIVAVLLATDFPALTVKPFHDLPTASAPPRSE
ncbi:MAG: UDP-N-acetylglucosamine 2-epimerase (hydrolyzing) [Planctomycetes bacterium]|nr:UDP-N-acetylglucosamine 2-epimerase (hydrolyzing) [Planctomycetota bacterium]